MYSNTITFDVHCEPVHACESHVDGGAWTAQPSCSLVVCEGTDIWLRVQDETAGTFVWTGPNSFSETITDQGGRVNISTDISTAGSGDYTVVHTDANGCTTTSIIRVTVVGCDYQDYRSGCTIPICHITSADLYIGSGVSAEFSTTGNTNADTDDDDGIQFPNNIRPGITVRFPTTIYNNTGQTVYLTAWVDWNGNEEFDDPEEQIINESYDYATYNGSFQVLTAVQVPSDAVQGQNIAVRYRLSTDSANINIPCGSTNCTVDGEVEDYLIQVECLPTICLPPTLTIKRN